MNREAFAVGMAAISSGHILLSQIIGDGASIINIDFDDEYRGKITFSDGSVVVITEAEVDADGKIKTLYFAHNDKTYYIDCTYDGDNLTKIGNVVIDDIETLGIQTTFNTQDKTVMPSTETQSVTADDDYDALGTVEVSGDENLVAENIKKGVTIFGVEGTASGSDSGEANLQALAFTSDAYEATATDTEGNTSDLIPTFDDAGTIQSIKVSGQDVPVTYDDNGVITKVGDVDISGVDLLSMFTQGGIGGGGEMVGAYCNVYYAASSGTDVTFTGIIPFNTVVSDDDNCYDTSTGLYTCPEDAYYMVLFSFYSSNSSTSRRASIFVDGTAVCQINNSYGDSVAQILKLSKGQTIGAGAKNSDFPLKTYSWIWHNSFQVLMISNTQTQPSVNYSTEEQVVGTWIDGKPLYQKTFEITNTISTTTPSDFTNIEHGIDNIDVVTNIMGAARRRDDDNSMWYPIGMADTDQTAYTIAVRMNSKYISYYIRRYSVGEIKKLFVTAQYTKTTD
jgi:hypothetical protein